VASEERRPTQSTTIPSARRRGSEIHRISPVSDPSTSRTAVPSITHFQPFPALAPLCRSVRSAAVPRSLGAQRHAAVRAHDRGLGAKTRTLEDDAQLIGLLFERIHRADRAQLRPQTARRRRAGRPVSGSPSHRSFRVPVRSTSRPNQSAWFSMKPVVPKKSSIRHTSIVR